MSDLRFLEGEAIYLSPIGPDDLDFFMEAMNGEDVRILARTRRDAMNEANTKEVLERLMAEDEAFLIRKKEGGGRIGYALLTDHDPCNREASLALVIAKREDRGKGHGLEAIRLLMRHGFVDLNLESLFLGVYEYNKAAIRLYEKAGFKFVGRRRNARVIGPRVYDEVIMDMIASEYFGLYGEKELGRYGL